MKPNLSALSVTVPVQRNDAPAFGFRADQVMTFEIRQDSLRQTEQGYWIVTIAAARTGLQNYVDAKSPSGWRVEFRSLDAITEYESLESWKHAPITIYHPQVGYVDLNNSPELKRGYCICHPQVECNPEDGEHYLLVHVLLDHPEAIDGVRSGALKEASAGYSCLFIAQPGEYKGVRYDGRQINIRINHLALLPEGMARAGRYATIRMDDGTDCFYFSPIKKGDIPMSEPTVTQKVRLDANAFVVLAPDAADKVQQALDARDTSIQNLTSQVQALTQEKTDAESQIQTLTQANSELAGRADATESARAALETQLAALQSTGVKADLKALVSVYTDCQPFLPQDFSLDAQEEVNARVIQVAALQTLAPDEDFTQRDDSYVNAYCVASIKAAKTDAVPAIGSGQPSAQARRLYDSFATQPEGQPQAPSGKSAYLTQLTESTNKRGIV